MQVLAFACGDRTFCIRITDVSEVLESAPVLSLPRAPSDFDGVFQLRGRIITLFNFVRCFGCGAEYSDSQIVLFAEPYLHFAIRVPGIVESVSLAGAIQEPPRSQDKNAAILEAQLRRGEDLYNLISISRAVFYAGALVQSQESAV